jgi:hypothetical protein
MDPPLHIQFAANADRTEHPRCPRNDSTTSRLPENAWAFGTFIGRKSSLGVRAPARLNAHTGSVGWRMMRLAVLRDSVYRWGSHSWVVSCEDRCAVLCRYSSNVWMRVKCWVRRKVRRLRGIGAVCCPSTHMSEVIVDIVGVRGRHREVVYSLWRS